MPEATLAELFERNARHAESIPEDYFDAVQSGQMPAVVSVCCSDSRVSQEGMWDVDEPGWLFTAGNIGNQVRDRYDGREVVSGDVLYPIRFTDTRLAAVVGHTGGVCDRRDTAHTGCGGPERSEATGVSQRDHRPSRRASVG